jgi:hypothetical protein
VSHVRDLARHYWFDVLIAVLAIVAMLEVVAEARDGLEATRRIIAANDAARICRLLGTELSRFNPRADGWQG